MAITLKNSNPIDWSYSYLDSDGLVKELFRETIIFVKSDE